MRWIDVWVRFAIVIGVLACAPILPAHSTAAAQSTGVPQDANSAVSRSAAGPAVDIHIEDVERFYKVYDVAGGHPTADQLQHDYLDPGSDGLHHLAQARRVTGVAIAKTLAEHPEIYSDAKRCMAVLPEVRLRLEVLLRKLADLYPEAKFPPITIAVSRGKPVAIGSPDFGVQIGLEALCAVKWADPNVENRFVRIIVHEYAHVQQAQALVDNEHPTVLERSLVEGAAEFTTELIYGEPAEVDEPPFKERTEGHEKGIETAFAGDENKTELSAWVDNSTMEKPGDLGYWVGYRIVKSYYQHATDKRQAVREILQMTDPKAFLAKSGWYPGIRLQ